MDTLEFIKKMPKAELHLHIEGTLEPNLMMRLSKKNGIDIPFNSIDEIKQAYQFENLQDFLNIYYQGANVLITSEDFYDLTWEYLNRAKADNINHVEIFFDPQTHTERGIPFETVITGIHQALLDAKSKLNISSYLIMCFLRDMTEEQAFATLEQAEPFKDKIKAVGLDSAEVGHPPEKFARVFAKAQEQGYLTVAHAGEEGPTSYIWEAIDLLKVQRIDHGIRAMEDSKLIVHLITSQLPLTVCPLSNVKLQCYKTMAEHNIIQMLDKGICVTVNSDDPAYFGGYLNENFIALTDTFNLNHQQLAQMAKNSFVASFLSPSDKEASIKTIESLCPSH